MTKICQILGPEAVECFAKSLPSKDFFGKIQNGKIQAYFCRIIRLLRRTTGESDHVGMKRPSSYMA
jgi:hypothetical protein